MSVFSFGQGINGALGLGKIENPIQSIPQKINYFTEIDKRVKKISCGSYHTVFITDDEQLYICGIKRDPKHGTTLFVNVDQSSNPNNPHYNNPLQTESSNNEENNSNNTTTNSNGNLNSLLNNNNNNNHNNNNNNNNSNSNSNSNINQDENSKSASDLNDSITNEISSRDRSSSISFKRPPLDRGIPHHRSTRALMQRPESPLLNKLLSTKVDLEVNYNNTTTSGSNSDDEDDDTIECSPNNNNNLNVADSTSEISRLSLNSVEAENIKKNITLIREQDEQFNKDQDENGNDCKNNNNSSDNNNNNNNLNSNDNKEDLMKVEIKIEDLSNEQSKSPQLNNNNNKDQNNNDNSNNNNQQQQQQQQIVSTQLLNSQQMEESVIYSTPVRISTNFLENTPLNIIKQVSLGNYHIVLLTEGGNVWTWGSNSNGQLGYVQDPNSPSNVPRMVEIKCVKTIATGIKNTAALTEWGELYMWGINEHGELGLGDALDRRVPTRVSRLKNETVTVIACSSTHSACYTESGKMYLWGQCGEAGKIQTIPTSIPIHSYLDKEIKNSGIYGGGGNIKQLACGEWCIAALTQMGEVFMWNVGGVPAPLRHALENHSVRSIAMGNFHLVCLTDSGEVITIGRNKSGQLGRGDDETVPGIVKQLSFGGGNGASGEGLNPDEFVVSIHAGEYHTVALVENTPKTKIALQLIRMQRNYLRQLNILNNIYYKSLMSMASPFDPVMLSVNSSLPPQLKGISGGIPEISQQQQQSMNGASPNQMNGSNTISGGSGSPISNSLSISSPSLLSGGTLKTRTTSIATIRGLFGINNMLHHSQSTNFQDENAIVTEEEIKLIFSDIESLSKLTEIFLNALDQRMDNWDPITKQLGDIFLDESLLARYRIYIPYSDSYNSSCMNLFNIRRRSERLSNIIKECEKKSISYGIRLDQEFVKEIDLKSLLLAPLQNIPRIYILLREMGSENIGSINHKDTDLINFAATKLQVLLERMNQNFQFVNAVEILHCSSNEYGNPQIMGGSITQLVEKLTHHNISDPNFRDVFLLTFRAFVTPINLLELLIEVFQRQKHFKNANRVVNVITSWVVHHFYDFERDELSKYTQDPNHNPQLLSEKLEAFINSEDTGLVSQIRTQYYGFRCRLSQSNLLQDQNNTTSSTSNMSSAINHQNSIISSPIITTKSKNNPTISAVLTQNINISSSYRGAVEPLPPNSPLPANFNLLEYPPIEVAQTLTLLDHHYFSLIDKREFLGKKWDKDNSPNIKQSTIHFNRTSQVVITEILKSKNSKARSATLSFFISVAYCCLELNNLSGTASIIYGLNNASIQRLKKTWSKLPKESTMAFEYLDKIVTPMKNYISLRHLMTTIQPPCVPFLGTYLKDLTFIEDGNPSIIGGLINFYKQRKIAEVIFSIQQYQQVTYVNLKSNSLIRSYLTTSETFNDKQAQKVSTDTE